MRSYVVDVARPPVRGPPAGAAPFGVRLGKTLGVAGAGLPYMLGLRRRTRGAATV